MELVDLFPSLAQLAFGERPRPCPGPGCLDLDGRSLAPLLSSSGRGWKEEAFWQYPRPSRRPREDSDQPAKSEIAYMGTTLRTPLFRFTQWRKFHPSI